MVIDGDCAIQSLRYKKGTKKYEWNELIDEIAHEIDILSLFGENIVLSHVVLPEDLTKYIEIFETRNIKYKFFLLKPEYQSAVKRCQTRTCHDSVTPEVWIKHFYDNLIFDDEAALLHELKEIVVDFIRQIEQIDFGNNSDVKSSSVRRVQQEEHYILEVVIILGLFH